MAANHGCNVTIRPGEGLLMLKRMFRFFARLRAVLSKRQLAREFAEEVTEHVAIATDEKIRSGMQADEARRAALLEFGNIGMIRENQREERSLMGIDRLSQDLKYATRQLIRQPVFTVVSICTLAVGIGAI